MTPSSTRKVFAKFSPSGCLLILMVQPDRSRPLNSECHSPGSAGFASAAGFTGCERTGAAASANTANRAIFMRGSLTFFNSGSTLLPAKNKNVPGGSMLRLRSVLFVVACFAVGHASAQSSVPPVTADIPPPAQMLVYDTALAPGWQNW